MEYKKSVIDLIKERKSTRTYDGRTLEEVDLKKFNSYLDEVNNENKIKARFKIVSNLGIGKDESKKLGTYGFIQGAGSYVIGIMDKDENDALEFGNIFERIVLFAADLGIQTCWLGGTFNKENFHQISELNDSEFIAIISPVGYKKDKRRVFETAMRAAVGADKRKTWRELFFNKNMQPLDEKDAGEYKIPLEMVRLGPSASNKQPWRVIKDENIIHFFVCRTKGYGITGYDLQLNDIGIAKCHFDLTLNELGIKGRWQKLKNDYAPNDWEYAVSWVAD
ncbi:nitroreductase [Sedimentibacter hydroxybenzoicus DSM 7310]|uniref:Nitroreductase n=1 Tax=Sedimentibacter hydroxybenzoicus DSM 7310 TaxID=1123245 RepID=A0A974BHH0_SEDHY|nr:nitroreductase family protein [Sedimentibacter hydroxybenzoicus]NYB73264.1 nitroreductase [Sedimentibacter hydroxybenzoicus DSM 7310]